jgi:hypothetical protein
MAACGCISTLGLWVLASTIVGFFHHATTYQTRSDEQAGRDVSEGWDTYSPQSKETILLLYIAITDLPTLPLPSTHTIPPIFENRC